MRVFPYPPATAIEFGLNVVHEVALNFKVVFTLSIHLCTVYSVSFEYYAAGRAGAVALTNYKSRDFIAI